MVPTTGVRPADVRAVIGGPLPSCSSSAPMAYCTRDFGRLRWVLRVYPDRVMAAMTSKIGRTRRTERDRPRGPSVESSDRS